MTAGGVGLPSQSVLHQGLYDEATFGPLVSLGRMGEKTSDVWSPETLPETRHFGVIGSFIWGIIAPGAI